MGLITVTDGLSLMWAIIILFWGVFRHYLCQVGYMSGLFGKISLVVTTWMLLWALFTSQNVKSPLQCQQWFTETNMHACPPTKSLTLWESVSVTLSLYPTHTLTVPHTGMPDAKSISYAVSRTHSSLSMYKLVFHTHILRSDAVTA